MVRRHTSFMSNHRSMEARRQKKDRMPATCAYCGMVIAQAFNMKRHIRSRHSNMLNDSAPTMVTS